MAIQPVKSERLPRKPADQQNAEMHLCDRDRLLAALKAAPRLSDEDARRIEQIVREAREASLADDLSA